MIITYKDIRDKMTEPYEMSLVGNDAKVVIKAVNQGIDSHLEACFVPGRGDKYTVNGHRLNCQVSPESLPVLLRRLTEIPGQGIDGEDADVAGLLVNDILESLGFKVETACYKITNE